jgi:YggT family protein
MNLNPFIELFVTVIDLYKYALSIWIILGWLIAFNIINTQQPFVRGVMSFLHRLIDPVLAYIRRFIPSINGIDLSAIILFLLINFFRSFLITYFYR